MPPAGFEPAIPVGERPQTHTLDRAATIFLYSLSYLFLTVSLHSRLSFSCTVFLTKVTDLESHVYCASLTVANLNAKLNGRVHIPMAYHRRHIGRAASHR